MIRTLFAAALLAAPAFAAEPIDSVNPFIGTTNGGNVTPGAKLPFGMVTFAPEETPIPGNRWWVAAAGGYEYRSTGIRGFSLTHVSGTGCAGAGGDVPFMPITTPVRLSPSSPDSRENYSSYFSHADERASPGAYHVKLGNGVTADLTATLRTAVARFAFPKNKPANLLIRPSDSQPGSSDATMRIDPATRTVSGTVTSGNFCGYLAEDRRESYYTLHFVAQFDQPFTTGGTWADGKVSAGATTAQGGTTYGTTGHPPAGKGSGGWISFDPKAGPVVTMRVGISYVDEAGARANLAEQSGDASFETLQGRAREAWVRQLGKIAVKGGTADERAVFYTALYHSLLEPSIYSDITGSYRGFDGKVHKIGPRQQAQYANFSGWDVYRSLLQLVTLIEPKVGSDIAQSLLNQAEQNGGVWDRWTHLTGATSVMNGDPSPPALAAIWAFGGRDFDLKNAYASLKKAATVPTALDLSRKGCPVLCVGQRPGLDQWMKLHYIPDGAPGWGSVADTLELSAADFGLAELARAASDRGGERVFRQRSGYWRNLYNPKATPEAGYLQRRRADGTWMPFDPADDDGMVEGSGAVYLWMVPFDPAGLIGLMGGRAAATKRLDGFFHDDKGDWAVTKAGPLHAELDNEPTIAAPWLYNFVGQPWQAQGAVRAAMRQIWVNEPRGISGNDDLGQMSSWYVWAAMGMYPLYPGRAELVTGSPLFDEIRIDRAKPITIRATGAASYAPYVRGLKVNGQASGRAWLPPSFIANGGTLDFDLSATPDKAWGSAPRDAPPSFGPR